MRKRCSKKNFTFQIQHMLNFPLKSSGDPPDGDEDTDEHRMNEREREGER